MRMNNELRPWANLAPGVAAPLRRRVPTLVGEVIDAVQSAVPEYAALDPAVSRGVHVALDGFLDLVEGGDETRLPGRDVYERFWDSIRRVQVSDVTSEAPSSVVATLRYDYDDGRTFIERTAYSLVRDGGQLKIDRSEVLSSRQT